LFQGYTGYWYGLYIYDSAFKDLELKDLNLKLKALELKALELNASTSCSRPKYVRTLAYGIHHGCFYGLCSLSGFVAWHLAVSLVKSINFPTVGGGTATILIALAVFAVLGVSGALSRILFMGKRPV
jgi:hypothetical protein